MDVDVGQIQRIIITFLVTKGIVSAEIYHRLSAVFKSDTLSHSRLFEWCAHFRSSRQSVNDDVQAAASVGKVLPALSETPRELFS